MRLLGAVGGTLVCALAVGGVVFYRMADVARVGLHGGPQMLAAGMGGLFTGGVVGVVVLIVLLRWKAR